MSPEQASGQTVGYRSDQFSLGHILYEMATGRRAFDRPTLAETLAAVINASPEPIPSSHPLPEQARWAIERCLSKEPEERYASTEDLFGAVKPLASSSSSESLPDWSPDGAQLAYVLDPSGDGGRSTAGVVSRRQLGGLPRKRRPGPPDRESALRRRPPRFWCAGAGPKRLPGAVNGLRSATRKASTLCPPREGRLAGSLLCAPTPSVSPRKRMLCSPSPCRTRAGLCGPSISGRVRRVFCSTFHSPPPPVLRASVFFPPRAGWPRESLPTAPISGSWRTSRRPLSVHGSAAFWVGNHGDRIAKCLPGFSCWWQLRSSPLRFRHPSTCVPPPNSPCPSATKNTPAS
ncbi:MAG: hypothetical protein FJW20_17065 [Acidimicrobiia bacterium]|nr:hypothetical protein [Acidimicrobiia bacterium]